MITGNEQVQGIVARGGLICEGLTIRQHFAAMAMQGILSNESLRVALLKDQSIDKTNNENYISNFAVKCTDALITELNKSK